MKKIITLLSVLLVVTSCSNKFSLQKRKYNKGFYFASTHSKGNESNTASQKAHVLNTKSYSQVKLGQQELNIVAPIIETTLANAIQNPNPVRSQPNLSKISQEDHSIAYSNTKQLQLVKLIKPIALPKAKKGGSDTNIIVLVILSLFPILCLIAVFLKDGKSITLNFWIDLLLHLTFIGEIIFALLVVLDVVNLA